MKRGTPYAEWTDDERARHRASKQRTKARDAFERSLEQGILTVLPPLGRWVRDAECAKRKLPSEMFHPPTDRPIPPAALLIEQRAAARACGACPVRDDCLTEARSNRFVGIWGGMLRTHHHSEHDLVAMHRAGQLTRPAQRQHQPATHPEGIAA